MSVYTFEMASGEFMDPLNPVPAKIHLSDIVKALAGEHRFNNQTKRPYSVLEHTINCTRLAALRGATKQQMIEVFTHDFEEAYTRDLSTPFKNAIPEFKAIAEKWTAAIDERFGIARENDAYTKEIDRDMLVQEAKAFMPSQGMGYWHLASGKSVHSQIVSSIRGEQPKVEDLRASFFYFATFLGLK